MLVLASRRTETWTNFEVHADMKGIQMSLEKMLVTVLRT